jgi:broad specificity phosphatase PhoE
MRRVYLLRHAKSSWKRPELADHDRPLAGRGKRAAEAIAKHMRSQQFEPELVLCSSARRARATLERKFPTAALATLAFHGSAWGELGPEATELVELTRPRDL